MDTVKILKGGFGYWSLKTFQIGGDFRRAKNDILLTNCCQMENTKGCDYTGIIDGTNEKIAFSDEHCDV